MYQALHFRPSAYRSTQKHENENAKERRKKTFSRPCENLQLDREKSTSFARTIYASFLNPSDSGLLCHELQGPILLEEYPIRTDIRGQICTCCQKESEEERKKVMFISSSGRISLLSVSHSLSYLFLALSLLTL